MATKTKTVSDFEKQGYTQVFGNFSATDVIEVLATTSPKKSSDSHAGKAYANMLKANEQAAKENRLFTVGDSIAAGNAGNRIKWDADPNRQFVRVWRKVS